MTDSQDQSQAIGLICTILDEIVDAIEAVAPQDKAKYLQQIADIRETIQLARRMSARR